MIIKNRQIYDSAAALQDLINIDLPIAISFKLSRITKEIDPIIISIEESRKKLIDKYAQKDEDGGFVKSTDNPDSVTLLDPAGFQKDLLELLEIEVEVKVDTISLSEFGHIKVKPVTLLALDWLIIE